MVSFRVYLKEKSVKPNELKAGDRVVDTNPDCKHYKSEGIVTAVKKIKGKKGNTVGNKIEYKCTNKGSCWKANDKLEKTESQLGKK